MLTFEEAFEAFKAVLDTDVSRASRDSDWESWEQHAELQKELSEGLFEIFRIFETESNPEERFQRARMVVCALFHWGVDIGRVMERSELQDSIAV